MASAFAKVLEAKNGGYQIDIIVAEALAVAKVHFYDQLYITIYQRTMLGIQPSIIPAS